MCYISPESVGMSTSIFVCLPTELLGLHHVDKSRLELKVAVDIYSSPVWMLSVVGAENSRIDLFAMTSNSKDKFR